MITSHPPRAIARRDLDHILALLPKLQSDLKNHRIFLTGGTGFFGCWLLEAIDHANRHLGTNISVTVLTRSIAAFGQKAPHLMRLPGIRFIEGHVCSFVFPDAKFDSVIHAASSVSTQEPPLELWDTVVNGTRRILDFTVHARAERLLLTSSGAVCGRQPPEVDRMPEDHPGAPDLTRPDSAYAQGKREAEWLCSVYAERHGLRCKIARCYAFVGPHLALDGRFAIGNFIRDALAGNPLSITGGGMSLRSYLYASDLVAWLLTILEHGQSLRPYNVGSDQIVSIRELATMVRDAINQRLSIEIRNTSGPGERPQAYVPCTDRARGELGLHPTVNLQQAICYTAEWHSAFYP